MTRLEFLSYIKQDFIRTDKDNEIYDALDDTLYEITQRFPQQAIESEVTINLVSAQSSYAFPSTFTFSIGSITFIDNSGHGYPLTKLMRQRFDDLYPDLTTAQFSKADPVDYTIYGNQIIIAPFPAVATAQRLLVKGTLTHVKLVLDADTDPFGDQWREVIKFGVLWRMYKLVGESATAQENLLLFEAGLRRMENVNMSKSKAPVMVAYRSV